MTYRRPVLLRPLVPDSTGLNANRSVNYRSAWKAEGERLGPRRPWARATRLASIRIESASA